jgi:predicted lipoprotein with Yx(FWY)xxD motif
MHPERSRIRIAPRRVALAAAVSLALAALAASGVLAAAGTLKLSSRPSESLGKTVMVNPAGRTLYTLSTETGRHLLCKGSCLKLWPPLTVASKATRLQGASGVKGRLGLIARAGGVLQVTLAGRPVYRFRNDHAPGEAGGEGLRLAGGVWHAVIAATQTPAMTPSLPPPTTPPYNY